MTEEEIKERRRQMAALYCRVYRKTEKGQQKCREYHRRAYEKLKQRMADDPAYREEYLAKQRERIYEYRKRQRRSCIRGRRCTMSERTLEFIAYLYCKEYKVCTIARRVNEPYSKVYQYVKYKLKPKYETAGIS